MVIGGGQAGLAAGYYLRRAQVDHVIVDDNERPGGSWSHYWDSLQLFSPADHSMLPGWWMPKEPGREYPSAQHVTRYLAAYEERYSLPVRRPVRVTAVERAGDVLRVRTDRETLQARHVISATGSWRCPHIPHLPGSDLFRGRQMHTVDYRNPHELAGQRVAVVGGGNSAAQILAELSLVAETLWATSRPPRFLPDDLDGRALFAIATRQKQAVERGEDAEGIGDLGNIVPVPSVRRARDRGDLERVPMFDRLTPTGVAWDDGTTWDCDAVLWCTGFRPALGHLEPLGVIDEHGRVPVKGNRAIDEPRLHLLGHGHWTGFASDTIIGAGRTAKGTVAEIVEDLKPRG